MWCPEDIFQEDVDQTTYLVSRGESNSLNEAYKIQYSSNPFGEGTLETGAKLIDTMKEQKRKKMGGCHHVD